MEPSGNDGWGKHAWRAIHSMTLDPNASTADRLAQKQMLRSLRSVLPCPHCRASYQDFCKSSLHECDPSLIGDYVCQLHDKVNLKLSKPAASQSWEFWKVAQLENFKENGWEYDDALFYFLFVIAANYPKRFARESRIAEKYKEFFQALGKSGIHTRLGKCIESFLETVPLSDLILSGRKPLLMWVHEMYLSCSSEIPKKSLASIEVSMDQLRK